MWPKFGFEDLPLKTYYAYAVPQWPSEEVIAGGVTWPSPLAARFTSLPATTTLSTQLDTPEAWLTGATAASLDLDNLKLEDLGQTATALYAEFEIESLIVSGSCIDSTAAGMGAYSEMFPTDIPTHHQVLGSPRTEAGWDVECCHRPQKNRENYGYKQSETETQ